MNYVDHFNLFGIDAKQIPCDTGEGAPTTATVGPVGGFYMDTLTGDVYKCVSAAGGIYTWEKMGSGAAMVDYDENVRTIAHRGYSAVAPENTIPAYILAKQMGYKYVECDVSFTSDNVAVLLHDSTIDRTSNGTGSIADMPYEQAAQYDYGSWKSSEYTGTTIPTFEEFIMLCKKIGLHP